MYSRAKVEKEQLIRIFSALSDQGYSISKTAFDLHVSERTLRDWRSGRHTIPSNTLDYLLSVAGLGSLPDSSVDYVDDHDQKSKAGKEGARKYWQKYSQLGDALSRVKGGRASYEKRKLLHNDIFSRNSILKPRQNTSLAEFVGIMIGDGNISSYQVSIALNMYDDADYAIFISQLAELLFDVHPSVYYRARSNCTIIAISSVELVEFLIGLGLPFGNKIRGGVSIPLWVSSNSAYTTACLRGIFDTDGGVYFEKHKRGSRMYEYVRLAYTSGSPALLEDIFTLLHSLGIDAKKRGDNRVRIENFTDIEKYFKIVGSSNTKHTTRYLGFLERSHSG